MIIIYKELIKKYISRLRPIHIEEFAKKQNVFLTNEEVNTLFHFIQKNYLSLLDNPSTILQLKPLLRDDLYQKVFLLYQEYYNKFC